MRTVRISDLRRGHLRAEFVPKLRLESFHRTAAVAELMAGFLALSSHEFCPDDLTLFDSRRVRRDRLLHSAQVTDSHLLALAAAHAGQLAPFVPDLLPTFGAQRTPITAVDHVNPAAEVPM